MPLKIYSSNNIEKLLEILSNKILENNQNKDFFDSPKHRIIIPTVINREWVNFELLKHLNSLFNIEYDTLDWSPYKIAKDLGIEHLDQTLSKKDLFFDILAIFNDDNIEINSFRDYFNDKYENISRDKKFQLAEKLSDLFVDYLENDNELIEKWNNIIENEELEDNLKDIEKEEYIIYKELCNKKYKKFLNINNIDFRKVDKNLTDKLKIYVFNYPYISKGTLDLLNNMSSVVDVYLFINYLNNNLPAQILDLQNKYYDNFTIINPQLSKNLKEKESINIDHISLEIINEEKAPKTCLDLLKNKTNNKLNQDKSLQIFSCQGTYREAECVYNSIIKNLKTNSNLKLEDICVLLTDINKYFPIVNGVFSNHSYRLPFNFICATPNIENSYIDGIKKLCTIVDNNLIVSDVIELISNECFKKKFNITDKEIQEFKTFTEEEHILAFYDKEQKNSYFKNDFSNMFTWQWKKQNLSFGSIIDENEEYSPLNWKNIIPQNNYKTNFKILNIIEKIFIEYTYLNSEEYFHNLNKKTNINIPFEIIKNFENFINDILEPIDSKDSISLLLENCIDDLLHQFNMRIYNPKFMDLFNYMMKEGASSNYQKGKTFVGGIIVSDLKRMPLSNYKIIYILGLNEGIFPRDAENSSLDLCDKTNKISITNKDKYALYKLICSTKEKVYLTYSNKDLEKDAQLYKSGTLEELISWLNKNLNKDFIEINMPKFGRSLNYYNEEYLNHYKNYTDDIVNYNNQDYNLALIDKASNINFIYENNIESNEKLNENIIIDINDLLTYLLNPLDWTLKNLDIQNEFEYRNEQIYEPINIEPYIENKIIRESLNKFIETKNTNSYNLVYNKYKTQGLISQGIIEKAYYDKNSEIYNKFAEKFKDFNNYQFDVQINYEYEYNNTHYKITGTIPLLINENEIIIIDFIDQPKEKSILKLQLLMLLFKIYSKKENIIGSCYFKKGVQKYEINKTWEECENFLKELCDLKDLFNICSYEAFLKDNNINNMKGTILNENNKIYLHNLITSLPKKFIIKESLNLEKINNLKKHIETKN